MSCNSGYICQGGRTYPVSWSVTAQGNIHAITAIDDNGNAFDPRNIGSWEWGACAVVPPTPPSDVFRVTQPLVAGNNVITHNLGFAPAEVEVRNAANGSEIAVRVVQETTTAVTINVAVAVASARISIDV